MGAANQVSPDGVMIEEGLMSNDRQQRNEHKEIGIPLLGKVKSSRKKMSLRSMRRWEILTIKKIEVVAPPAQHSGGPQRFYKVSRILRNLQMQR